MVPSLCLITHPKQGCSNGCCPLHFPPPQSSITTAAFSRHEFEIAMISSLSYPDLNPVFTNPESLPSLHQSLSTFTANFPQFCLTDLADSLRRRHYSHLSPPNHACFDYIGHGLFSYSQASSSIPSTSASPPPNSGSESLFFDVLYRSVSLVSHLQFGAPESALERRIRARIMEFMNVSEDDYAVVFAANQSSAFRIVADSYPFHSHKNVLTVYDYENEAVSSMVETCKKRGARAQSAEFVFPQMRIHSRKLQKKIETKRKNKRGLLVFPLQSRITGAKYSYSWMKTAEENGWHVLLDATALGAKDMETLGLNLFKPDFLVCSFYKLFGDNPSGFACLFVKRSNLGTLKDSNIGIVKLKPVSESQNQQITSESSELEEANAEIGGSEMEFRGLDDADELGLVVISARTRYLINWLINALMSLEHPHSENGHPAIKIYGPKIKFERGPAVAFNLFDWKGEKIEPKLVQKLADRNGVSLSCGVLKNIWVREEDEERGVEELRGGNGVSVVTVAMGFLTNFEDVYRLWVFVSRFLDADFVEKERWRYFGLNRNVIEV